MYYDKKHNRVLLRDGRSIVSLDQMTKYILVDDIPPNTFCLPSEDTELYQNKWGIDLSSDIEDVLPTPPDPSLSQDQYSDLLTRITASSRYTSSYDDRIEKEMKFFSSTNNLRFVYECMKVVDKFKQDGVVWGVGRGSCCASVVLYLIELHDIDPMMMDIPFSELSKENESVRWKD
jgi:DNA polymerase III alpha subunit